MSRVAVVGGGPAGKAAARMLRDDGIAVTIFEKEATTGGLMRFGYPAYRMPAEISQRDAGKLSELGVEFQHGRVLGEDLSLAELEAEFDAVILAIGAGKPQWLGIPGEDLPHVYHALEFLYRVRHDDAPELGQEVIVIGGGDTALDAATTSRTLGAQVRLHYRGDQASLRGLAHERKRATEAGVIIDFRRVPEAIVTDRDGRLAVRYGRLHESCDSLIVAVGQTVDTDVLGSVGVLAKPDGTTNRPTVFVAGGTRYGSDRLSEAILDGRRAAAATLEVLHRRHA